MLMLIRTKSILFFVIPLLLIGCEASLNLEQVNKEQEKQIRRTDQFQALAINHKKLVAVGSDGLILSSPVSDLKWQRQTLSKQSALIDVSTCPDQSFVALSMDKKVWRSVDDGSTWSASELPTVEDVLAITCAPNNSIWVVGSFSSIWHSNDQAKAWQESTLNEDAILTSIQFINEKIAFITGEFGLVSRSDDGGKTWNPAEYIPNDFYVQDAFFRSPSEAWVGGLSGQILYTNDGGKNWTQQQTPTDSPIYGFYQTPSNPLAPNQIIAIGDHSTVLRYTGKDWQAVKSTGKPVYLGDVIQIPNGKLLLAGGSGSLYTQEIGTPNVGIPSISTPNLTHQQQQ